MKIAEIYRLYLESGKISTDTRKISKNSIFFALRGANFDGNQYAHEALNKGARYVVADDKALTSSDNIILVNNSLETLQQLATYHRENLNLPVLAITGSNGKTTTKELIDAVLSSKYKTYATPGNYNNHIGVPLTLLAMDSHTEIGIVEMGANHPNEIDFLCKIAKPDFGIITNIGRAHIEGFGSLEGVIKTKTELYNYLCINKGLVFYNASNQVLSEKVNHFNNKATSYGDNTSRIIVSKTESSPHLSLNIIFDKNEKVTINTKLIGNYNTENILAAICIGMHFKIDFKRCCEKIEEYTPSNMRSQWIKSQKNKIILDAYNANPTSVQLALKNFSELKSNNKVAILGDMKEIGKEEEKEHTLILDYLLSQKLAKTILVGPIYIKLRENYTFDFFADVNELIDSKVLDNIIDQDILIKGSRGVGLEKITPYL